MLRSLTSRNVLARTSRITAKRPFSSTEVVALHHPKAPVDLDPSFRDLLRDADMSILKHTARQGSLLDGQVSLTHQELEVYPPEASPEFDYLTSEELDALENDSSERRERKSPAALFGSQRLGAVVLPDELQATVSRLISDSNKPRLHDDAKRLFLDESVDDAQWGTSFNVRYKSWQEASRRGERDGTAFASIALPSHYSAIYAVFDHLKKRLGPDWNVEHIIDWGSGTGSGLWAALHAFQKQMTTADSVRELKVKDSAISTYVGIDKREGLVSIGKRLLQGVDRGNLSASWQKSFQDSDKLRRAEARNVIALSAFYLSSLPTPLQRKALVKEMWESGANTIVLIDHSTTAGFENIAEARQNLLRMGRREIEDPETVDWEVRGSHVVAPCPHDGNCPLYQPGSSRLVCGFSQRLQRPEFVRKTKHSGVGHEDTGYSYIVIRRGERPPKASSQVGRLGDVGQRELAKINSPMTELLVDSDTTTEEVPAHSSEMHSPSQKEISSQDSVIAETQSEDQLGSALRAEAYNWPRLVFPPLKRSGHIILDACTEEAKIMRMIIPKSQGKQPFYDARKSTWGDIFPHAPKNEPTERYQPQRAKRVGGTTPTKGSDIGKRGRANSKVVKTSYDKVTDDILGSKKVLRHRRQRVGDKLDWEVDS